MRWLSITKTDDGKHHPLFLALWIALTIVFILYRKAIYTWGFYAVGQVFSHVNLDQLSNAMDGDVGLGRAVFNLLLALAIAVVGLVAVAVLLIPVFLVWIWVLIPVLSWGAAYVLTFVLRKTIWPISLDAYLGFAPGVAPGPRALVVTKRKAGMREPPAERSRNSSVLRSVYIPTREEVHRAAANPLRTLLMSEMLKNQQKIARHAAGTVRIVREGLEDLLAAEKVSADLANLDEVLELEAEKRRADIRKIERDERKEARQEKEEVLGHEKKMATLRGANDRGGRRKADEQDVPTEFQRRVDAKMDLARIKQELKGVAEKETNPELRQRMIEAIDDVAEELAKDRFK